MMIDCGRLTPLCLLLAATLGLFFTHPARAADIEAVELDEETVAIFVIGTIETGDASKFRRVAANHEEAIVMLESPGGATVEAIDIGEAIRLLGYSTLVINGSDCTSACALIWLAGSPRIITTTARVGFHATYIDDRGSRMESGVGNALVGRYLTLLNLPMSAVIFATRAPPDSLVWLDATNFGEAGIDTVVVNDFEADQSDRGQNRKKRGRVASPPPIQIAPSAQSRPDTELFSESGDWLIMTDHTMAGSCFIVKYFDDGTILRLSNDTRYSLQDGDGFLLLTNPAWASVTDGREFNIDFQFGQFEPWNAVASVMQLGGFNWLHVTFAGENGQLIKRELAQADSMSVSRDGKLVVSLNLQGSARAIERLMACQSASNTKRAQNDPFAD